MGNFGALYVGIMYAKFQAFCFNGVGGECLIVIPDPYKKFKSPFAWLREG